MKTIVKIGLLSLSLTTLVACGNSSTPVTQSPATTSQVATSGTAISLDDAKALAFKAAQVSEKDVTNLTVQEDMDNGRAVYDIEFTYQGTEYSYSISAADGSLVEQGAEAADATRTTAVTGDQAKAVALKDAGLTEAAVTNLTVTQDTDDTKTVYDVEFTHQGREYSYTIDATTNAILEKESEAAGN